MHPKPPQTSRHGASAAVFRCQNSRNDPWDKRGPLLKAQHARLPGQGRVSQAYRHCRRPVCAARQYLARSSANRVWLEQAFALARAQKLAGLMLVIQANPGLEAANDNKPKLAYRDFLNQLREETQVFAGQVVLVHGDSHAQKIDQPLLDATTKEVIRNFTRVETYGYPFMGWIKASADASDPRVFTFSPRRWNPPK